VRPLRLTMRGLRSYRGECTIDFRDRGLLAIVGDTGAGKSSILEAITYALYNATTWEQRAVGQLISDGVQSMSVELEFQAGDRVWSVHRACHRAAGRASTHRLRCLSDPSAGDSDGEAAVSRQVERLLGMSYHAYKAAVVLPQGRFQTLLHETPAKRTGILEGIFRLDDLRGVQRAARELGDRVAVSVGKLKVRRDDLLQDPAAARAALEAKAETLRGREAVLLGLQAEAAAVRDAVREADGRADALREHARLVAARPDGGVAVRLAGLVPLAASIQTELDTAAEAEAAARSRVAGESVELLAGTVEALRGVRHALAEAEADDLAAERERAALDAASAAWAADEAGLPVLEAAARTAGEAASAAASARAAAVALDAAGADERRRREALPDLEAQLAECRRLSGEASNAVEVRRTALEDGQRRDAAAHAAEGLRPGDPCPVCGRPLGQEFRALSSGALGPLKRALKEAEADLAACGAGEAAAEARLDDGRRRLAEAVTGLEAAAAAARERLAELRVVAPGTDPGLDLAAAAQQAAERLLHARADLKARRAELDRRTADLGRKRERVDGQRARCADRLRALAVDGAARPEDLDGPIAAAATRLDAATRARGELDALRAEVTRLQRRRQDEVDGPRALVMRDAVGLLLRVNDGLRAVGQPALDAAPAGVAIEAEAGWTAGLDLAAAELRRLLGEEIAAAQRAAADTAAALARRLTECGIADAGVLDDEQRLVSRQLGRVQGEMETAAAQVPVAAELDARIATGVEVRDSLLELARLLQDSQFVGHVIERRQRQLLAVASQILGSMTGGAYGFASDFEIVDRFTNQPRPTRTLSGGETFLASLALALALVEIAARSGTQLDALFLDEGFGSLDANALDEALSALELQAGAGRLVAVVSHVRGVAERIETVLEVTRTAAGSRAEWRGDAERELMLAEEHERRLLA
jgi:exonuclease SbcC